MTTKALAVIFSATALALLAGIAYAKRPIQPATAAPPVEVLSSESAPPVLASSPPALTNSPAPRPPFTWRELEAEDYHQYIANLRAFGCPEQTIRDIILADVNKLYAARENPLKSKPQPVPGGAPAETREQELERLRELRAVQQEKRWVVKELLDVDIPLDLLPSSGSRDYRAFEVAFRFLPAEKRDAVQMLQENYWQQSDAIKAKHGKNRTAEFVAESRQLTESLRQQLAGILSPRELEDYDMRTSSTAKQLSSKLSSYFHPTEDEYRQIFRAKRDHDEALARLAPTVPAVAPPADPAVLKAAASQAAADRQALEQGRAAALSQMNEQLKSTLGDQRYAEYERSQDRTFDLLSRLGLRYGLPQEKVLEAYDLQKGFNVPSGPVNNPAGQGSLPDKAERQRQLDEQLTAILGEQAARGYRRVHGGTIPVR